MVEFSKDVRDERIAILGAEVERLKSEGIRAHDADAKAFLAANARAEKAEAEVERFRAERCTGGGTMSVRNVIAYSLSGVTTCGAFVAAEKVAAALCSFGYVILPAAEVEAIRDKALEEAAVECDRIDNECGMEAGLAASCAECVRTLKGAKP